MSFQIIRSSQVFSGRAFSIRRDLLLLPDGRQIELDIIDHVDSVAILPIDQSKNILFVRQYRHATGSKLLEIPAGILDLNEDPLVGAQRELREETGMAAELLQPLGGFYLAPGYTTEYMHVFLATKLLPNPLPSDLDEYLSIEMIPIKQAFELPAQGLLQDAKSLAALYLAQPHLEKFQNE